MTDTLDPEPVVRFDWTDHGSTSTAVVEAVSTATGDDVTEMAPLYQTVDPDALDRIFSTPTDAGSATVEFAYNGHEVAVASSGDGWVK